MKGWHIPRENPVNKYVVYGLIFLAGVVLAPKVKTLPLLDKLPSL